MTLERMEEILECNDAVLRAVLSSQENLRQQMAKLKAPSTPPREPLWQVAYGAYKSHGDMPERWGKIVDAIRSELIRRGELREVKPVTDSDVEEAWEIYGKVVKEIIGKPIEYNHRSAAMRAVLEKFAK